LQRLFSTFPNAWPGAGLLLLRLAAGIALIIGGSPELRGLSHSALFAAEIVAVSVGILLFAGLWTPLTGALQAIIELWIAFSRGREGSIHLLAAALGVSLAMLGPGAWSIDARLFGRKQIDIPSR
jgi:uncharacterized membrane protein YphA (DoxX/SURF4 family)